MNKKQHYIVARSKSITNKSMKSDYSRSNFQMMKQPPTKSSLSIDRFSSHHSKGFGTF